MNKFIAILTVAFLAVVGDVPKQKINSLEEVISLLEKHSTDYPTEKLYLHTSQPYFAIGEHLWFKAYLVAGPHHIPSPLSKTIYAELVDPDGKVVQNLKLPVSGGVSKGDFALSNDLASGVYTLRAYTNWMKNFDPGYIFQKSLEVINPNSQPETPKTNNADKIEQVLKFYPEGGDLVIGLPSVVAFEDVLNTEFTGTIYDSDDRLVTTFEASGDNRGAFEITPEAGKSYYAKVTGSNTKFELPAAKLEGFTMHVDNSDDAEHVQVVIASKNAQQKRLKVYLLVQTRGMMTYATEIGLAADIARFDIPKNVLQNGISQITLFDGEFRPQSERLIYTYGSDAITSDISSDKDKYVPREQTKIKIQVKDANGKPVEGNFSIAAFDTKQINPDHIDENIVTSLLLNSDIIGNIHNPTQFVDDKANTTTLDLMLMTKGWRRFKWKDLLENGVPTPEFESEQGFKVTGRATKRNGKALTGGSVRHIGQFAGLSTFEETTINPDGSFSFEGLQYVGDSTFIEAVDKRGRKELVLELDAPQNNQTAYPLALTNTPELGKLISDQFYAESKERELNDAAFDNTNIQAFLQRSQERKSIDSAYNFDNVTDLGTVTVQNNQNDKITSNATRGLVFNRGEYSVSASDLMSHGQKFPNALYILQGRIPGFTIVLDALSSEPAVQMTRKIWSFRNPDPPILYIIDDGIVGHGSAGLAAITSLPAEKVERIEVLKGMKATSVYGTTANGGAIVIYTKTGPELTAFNKRLLENAVSNITNVKRLGNGYYQAREFYTPDYSQNLPEHIKPDRRALIHWEPMIRTNGDGIAEIDFFNADLETTIQINLEGVSDKGELLSNSWSYQVTRIKP